MDSPPDAAMDPPPDAAMDSPPDAAMDLPIRRLTSKDTHLRCSIAAYFGDLGLRHALFGDRDADIGGLLENVVYLELRRRGYEAKVGALCSAEVELIAEWLASGSRRRLPVFWQARRRYSRSSETWSASRTTSRKVVLAMGELGPDQRNGIRRQDLVDFLMEVPP